MRGWRGEAAEQHSPEERLANERKARDVGGLRLCWAGRRGNFLRKAFKRR